MEENPTFEACLRNLLFPIIAEAIEKSMVRHFQTQPIPQQAVPEILDVNRAAVLLGVSKGWIYKLTHRKKVPYYTTGKRVYFRRQELVEWVTRIRVKPASEIEQEAINYITTHKRKY